MRELHLFAGAGGGILGGILLGHTCVCAVEIEPYRRKVLLQRQRDGILPRFPIWDDIRTFDGRPWLGLVDIVAGGFPCQDIAPSSKTRTGLDGERSGLWTEMRRVVCEIGPTFVLVENSAIITSAGLGRILSDMASMGYDARWGVFSAADVGARHERERMFLLAHRYKKLGTPRPWTEQQQTKNANVGACDGAHACDCFKNWMAMACAFAGRDDVLSGRMDRTSAIGDGQVPAVVKLAWETLMGDF